MVANLGAEAPSPIVNAGNNRGDSVLLPLPQELPAVRPDTLRLRLEEFRAAQTLPGANDMWAWGGMLVASVGGLAQDNLDDRWKLFFFSLAVVSLLFLLRALLVMVLYPCRGALQGEWGRYLIPRSMRMAFESTVSHTPEGFVRDLIREMRGPLEDNV